MKDKFAVNAECMAAGLTVRETAETADVAVSTAYRWRHRFLNAVVAQQPKAVEGLLEADETYFLHSLKGQRKLPRPPRHRGGKAKKRGLSKEQVPVLVAIARGQRFTADRVMPAMSGKELVETLRPVVNKDTIVCSDGNPAYYALQRQLGVTLKMFSASKHGSPINPSFHVQNVNSYHSRLKGWINVGLRGVATKYLPNYLAWQRLLTWFRDGVTPEQFIASSLGRQLINT
ncbi:IS1595 family transposase [Cupriavidus sp. D39]|uniref:IS1595 family transposase n=1 Tax=Cupriavidus sp. D39 TaxID=2997877 RepID=UPI00226E341D|nr:IS1595 family transposase [Cupriavidus sp. D39]MCY0856641.1 IS1595 family transposase [Cupriavidus sp. D39]